MSKWFRINKITVWEANRTMVQTTADHSDASYDTILAEAQEMAVNASSNGEGKSLPFICEAADKQDALAQYVEKFYDIEFAIPVDAEIDEVHKFEVERQIDCRDYVEVFATSFAEARDKASEMPVENDKLELIETHIVDATDKVTGEFQYLC